MALAGTTTALVYDDRLSAYGFGEGHPLRPERVSLAVDLIGAYGLVDGERLVATEPRPASLEDLHRVHDPRYVAFVQTASDSPDRWVQHMGIGPGDTPAFRGMHEAAALVAGATTVAVEAVTSGRHARALAPAGGLHHAHRDRAAGFCVYNDVAVAIAAALARDPALRVAYLDIDAHHGDGVQEAFYHEPRVLTISLHEDGRYLYPGTGSWRERGEGEGTGTAVNVPLPPYATAECYRIAFDEVVGPAVRAFGPGLIVTQNGADAHWSDPLTSLGQTVGGYEWLFEHIVRLADEVCAGRLVACGGGGYAWATAVPRIWTLLAASLVRVSLADELPEAWVGRVRGLGVEPPPSLRADVLPPAIKADEAEVVRLTRRVIESLVATV